MLSVEDGRHVPPAHRGVSQEVGGAGGFVLELFGSLVSFTFEGLCDGGREVMDG